MTAPTITPLERACIKACHVQYQRMLNSEIPWNQKTYDSLVGLLIQNAPALIAAAEALPER